MQHKYPQPCFYFKKSRSLLCKLVAGFANEAGGYIILGVRDEDYHIVGIESTLYHRSVVEWINQVISAGIEEKVSYPDPRTIEIPESDKVLVVIYIPESIRKPHQVNEKFQYPIRVNDSVKPANHYEVRDMFEFRRQRASEKKDFLKKRNLLDDEYVDFGINITSKNLYHLQGNPGKPVIIVSILPRRPFEVKHTLSPLALTGWLDENSSGYSPVPHQSLFHVGHDYEVKLDGIILNRFNGPFYSSYLEIQNNGYLEASLPAESVFGEVIIDPNDASRKKPIVYLTPIIAYIMMLLGFTKKFYQQIVYQEETWLQVSFARILHHKLFGLHTQYGLDVRNPRYRTDATANKHHLNFKVEEGFFPSELDNKWITITTQQMSLKICRAFGLEENYGFYNGEIDKTLLNSFKLY